MVINVLYKIGFSLTSSSLRIRNKSRILKLLFKCTCNKLPHIKFFKSLEHVHLKCEMDEMYYPTHVHVSLRFKALSSCPLDFCLEFLSSYFLSGAGEGELF